METIHDVGSVRIRVEEVIGKSWKSCRVLWQATGTRRNMSHVVELTKDCTSAVLIVKASRPLIFKELTRMPGLWLAYFPSQRSKDGHVFYH
jgi:hypothetical protein